jgi:DNA-binding transcriptional LysR family regulator
VSDLAEPEEFQILPLRRHPVFLLARPGHPLLARGSAIGFEDVLRYPLIRFSYVPARFAPHMAAAMANIEAAAATIPPSMTIEDPAAALAIAAASDALVASTAPQVKPWVQSGALAVVPWRPSWLQSNFGVVYLRHLRLSPLQQDLLDCLQAADAEAFALGQAMMPAGLPPPEEGLAVVGRRTAPALIRA